MAVSPRRSDPRPRAVHLIAVTAGGALLAAYWLVPRLAFALSPFGRVVYWATAAALVVWGGVPLVMGTLPPVPRQRLRRRLVLPELLRGRLSISWRGVFLVLIGIELVSTQAWRGWNGITQGVIAAGGLASIFWGTREILAHLAPSVHPQHRRLHWALLRPGGAYLVIMCVLFIGSMLGRQNMLMLVFAMMAGPFLVNGSITFAMLQRNRLDRTAPPRVMAGDTTSVELTLHNRKRFLSNWLMSVTDEVANDREHLEAAVLFARVSPRDARSASYQLRLMQRGIYRVGPATIATRFPLGLVERGLTFDEVTEIIVHPRIGHLLPAWKRQFGVADELIHRQETRRGVFDDEFHGIREYRWGDNPRAIHWRTSARLSQTMVREFHQSRDRDLMVLLELWLPRRPDEADRERVELAVSFAASVCVDHMRQSRDSNVSVASAGDDVAPWEGLSCPATIEPLLDRLAVAPPGEAPDTSRLIEWAAARRTSNARMVLITTRPRSGRGFAEWSDGVSRRTVGDWGGDLQIVAAAPDELSRYLLLQ